MCHIKYGYEYIKLNVNAFNKSVAAYREQNIYINIKRKFNDYLDAVGLPHKCNLEDCGASIVSCREIMKVYLELHLVSISSCGRGMKDYIAVTHTWRNLTAIFPRHISTYSSIFVSFARRLTKKVSFNYKTFYTARCTRVHTAEKCFPADYEITKLHLVSPVPPPPPPAPPRLHGANKRTLHLMTLGVEFMRAGSRRSAQMRASAVTSAEIFRGRARGASSGGVSLHSRRRIGAGRSPWRKNRDHPSRVRTAPLRIPETRVRAV